MNRSDLDLRLRLSAFDWLARQVDQLGDVLDRDFLQQGFPFEGRQVPLVAPQGIFKPRELDLPLTITTTPDGPYEDHFGPDGLLNYRYRGTDPEHPDNVGLRRAMAAERPLIYFHGIVPGRYLAAWPVYIVGDSPQELSFKVAVDSQESVLALADAQARVAEDSTPRRVYITATVRRRVHQSEFRERVLRAYQSQCSFCRLRHRELLDAAHIFTDLHPEGEPRVDNGLALCKLHHAAFDNSILGVSPDHVIHVRQDILAEVDGPMLHYGLQQLDGASLHLPARRDDWPSPQALDWRYERFVTGRTQTPAG